MCRIPSSGDPQLHSHCVIANLVQRDDGAWVALDATALYRWAKAAGSVYQEQLRLRLSERLGVGWGPDRNGCREMAGITETQLRAFSKRTVQIEAHLAATGQNGLTDRKARMRADEAASVATRARKDRTLTPERLQDRWTGEAEAAGLPVGDALLAAVVARAETRRAVGPVEIGDLFEYLADPEVGLCAHDSRFGEAQVVEGVSAWGAGRLTTCDIEGLTRSFLDSDRVVRLLNADRSGRAPGQWSTVAHRRVEDRVLDHLAVLRDRQVAPLDPAAVERAIAAAARLGDDQAGAVRALAGGGAGLAALISPAGYGKTTTLAAADEAARLAGRPLLAVSTTNQAVDQLRQVGIPAATVARFAIEQSVLEARCVLIVDEFSQLPTREADIVLAAVAACEGGQVWLVGDPLQAQPVAAGGLAAWLAEHARQGLIPVAELNVNRRQSNPTEREALSEFRQGHIDTSQDLRDGAGWEHHHADRDQSVDAMAAAVLADIDIYGPDAVAALAVTHADCEAIADRIRAELVSQGVIAGPVMEGPGWAGVRSYQAGDRIVLHAHAEGQDGRRLTNGTVATITEVTPTGITVADRAGAAGVLPARFVAERGADGRPRVSHAWGRTIDGVQGGTWAQVHLLATPALDRYRGYVGQSRSIAPTHTWNTTSPRGDDGDHGGRVVGEGYSTPAEVIAAALARAQPKTFAAVDDPYRIDADLRSERKAHRDHLAHRPPDVSDHIDAADKVIAARQQTLADLENQARYWQDQQHGNAGLRGITPSRREKHHTAARYIENLGPSLQQAHHHLTAAITDRDALIAQQADCEVFDRDNHWRVERLDQLRNQLDRHWTDAVIQAARDGHPIAYGTQLLYTARRDLAKQINGGQAVAGSGPPVDVDAIRDLQMLDRAIPEAAQHQGVVRVAAQARPAPGRSAHAPHQHVTQTGASRGPTIGN